jgi:hypothetical protein
MISRASARIPSTITCWERVAERGCSSPKAKIGAGKGASPRRCFGPRRSPPTFRLSFRPARPPATLGQVRARLASADPHRYRGCHLTGSRGYGARCRFAGRRSPARCRRWDSLLAADCLEARLRLTQIASLDTASRQLAHGKSEPRLARGRSACACRTKRHGPRRQRPSEQAGGGARSG